MSHEIFSDQMPAPPPGHSVAPGRREKQAGNGAGSARNPEQPFSDGSEEFFEQFTPRDETGKHVNKKALMLGLGLTLGLAVGAGTTLWLRRARAKKSWWRRLLNK